MRPSTDADAAAWNRGETAGNVCGAHSDDTSPAATSSSPTWGQVVALEPQLGDLLAYVRSMPLAYNTDPYDLWFGPGGLKAAMACLVGYLRHSPSGEPLLFTSAAYDVAYRTLLGGLERRCGRWRS